MFSKLSDSITRSSLWSEKYHVRVVFVSLLSLKDDNGFVEGTRSSLQRICNVTMDEFDEAIKVLSSPDHESKTPDFEGRRIDKIEGGWVVLNHEKYRLPEQTKKENRNEYMRAYMAKKRAVNSNIKLTPINSELTSVSVSISSSVSSSEEESEEKQKTWRESFDAYLSECKRVYEALLLDAVWISEQQRFHPNVDIKLSLEKSFKNFWGTETGWKYKKKKKSQDLNWKSTFTNAIDMNKVYKPREHQQSANSNYREV